LPHAPVEESLRRATCTYQVILDTYLLDYLKTTHVQIRVHRVQ